MVRLILAIGLLALVISCSKKTGLQTDDHVPSAAHSAKLQVRYDSDVPSDQQRSLERDLEFLSRVRVTALPDQDYAKLIGIPEVSGPSLNKWLGDRTKVFVNESFKPFDFDEEGNLSYIYVERVDYTTGFTYSPEIFSDRSGPSVAATNAENTGALVYLVCKGAKIKCHLKLVDGTSLPVTTPRIGVVRIGEGLFMARVSQDQDARASIIVRLGTGFHEAAHTNGNGADACMPHAKCPANHDYRGQGACDRRSNGPYPIGVAVLKHLLPTCGLVCTEEEKQKIKILIADYETRLLPGSTYVDPRPERVTF